MDKIEIKRNIKVEIKYEDSFVAFLDVLGFTDLVKNDKTDKINTYLEEVEFMISMLKEKLANLKMGLALNHIIISDSIILSVQKTNNSKKDMEIFQVFCLAIATLQAHLSLNDIWLRGGISSGKTYFNNAKKQVIGKGYINAYLLESNYVSNPQVIIDNKIINQLGYTNSKEFIDDINTADSLSIVYDWSNTNYIEKDFPFFIDYIGFLVNNIDGERKINYLKDIIKNIDNNIYSHVNLYSKYKWVANYVLSSIDKSDNFKEFKEKLKLF